MMIKSIITISVDNHYEDDWSSWVSTEHGSPSYILCTGYFMCVDK